MPTARLLRQGAQACPKIIESRLRSSQRELLGVCVCGCGCVVGVCVCGVGVCVGGGVCVCVCGCVYSKKLKQNSELTRFEGRFVQLSDKKTQDLFRTGIQQRIAAHNIAFSHVRPRIFDKATLAARAGLLGN